MIQVIVFSRDRALQLEATLRSFRLHVRDAETAEVTVLYRATTSRHEDQYRRLSQETRPAVRFLPEADFKAQLLGMLAVPARTGVPGPRDSKDSDFPDSCLFLVDDSIFVRHVSLLRSAEALFADAEALGLSLRLGRNTTYCYSAGKAQKPPKFHDVKDGILKFRWVRADGDFGYPLELSSSLYRLKEVAQLIGGLGFDGPSSLESQMSILAAKLARTRPALLCYERSVAFSVPVNKVQQVYQNRAGTRPDFSTESLAAMFEQGKRINVDNLSGFTPNGCHQEVELGFE